MEMDDDVFFADLSKQIALLITDDDDNNFPVKQQGPLPVPFQGFVNVHPQAIMPPPPQQLAYELAYRRESKGTGVFIPHSSLPRRKNRSNGRSTSSSNRQSDTPGVAVPRLSNRNCRCSNNYYDTGAPNRHT